MTAAAPVSAEALERSLDRVLTSPRYQWMPPRELVIEGERPFLTRLADGFLDVSQKVVDGILHLVREVLDWLGHLRSDQVPGAGGSGGGSPTFWAWALGLALLIALVAFVWVRRRGGAEPEVAEWEELALDPEAEAAEAGQAAPDRWLALAEDLRAGGDLRAALRALYLGFLSRLSQLELLTLDRRKTNRDYTREVARRDRSGGRVEPLFRDHVSRLEAVWFGAGAIDDGLYRQARGELDRLDRWATERAT